jgi:DNA-binding NarL/FixJ family response regulator
MDLSMPGMDGLSASREILKAHAVIAIFVLSMHDTKQLIESACQAGVKGYVSKSQAGSALLNAVDAVAKGQTFFPA